MQYELQKVWVQYWNGSKTLKVFRCGLDASGVSVRRSLLLRAVS